MSRKYALYSMVSALAMVASTAEAIPLSVEVGPLFMSREGGGGVIVTDAVTGAGAIDSANLNGNYDVGPEVDVAYRMGSWGAQLRGLTLDLDSSEGFVSTTGNNLIILTNPTTGYGINVGDTFNASLATSLSSFEANALYDSANGIEYFAGLRNITLDETLGLTGVFGSTSREDDVWKVSNDLMGVQAGANFDFAKLFSMSGRLHPKVRAGIGAYDNSIDGSFTVSWNGVPVRGPVSATKSSTSLSFDLDATLHYELMSKVSLYAGLRMLYLSNVALGPDQIASTTRYNVQPSYTISDGSVRFQGLKAGVAISF